MDGKVTSNAAKHIQSGSDNHLALPALFSQSFPGTMQWNDICGPIVAVDIRHLAFVVLPGSSSVKLHSVIPHKQFLGLKDGVVARILEADAPCSRVCPATTGAWLRTTRPAGYGGVCSEK